MASRQAPHGTVSKRRHPFPRPVPLENLCCGPEQEYFADGMTEELITDLAQIRSLRVISRTSVMAYKGTKKPLPQVGRELNVDAILEGSVQRSGERVRITAQLIDAATEPPMGEEATARPARCFRFKRYARERSRRSSHCHASGGGATEGTAGRPGSSRTLSEGALLLEQEDRDGRSEGRRVLPAGDREGPRLYIGLCGSQRWLDRRGILRGVAPREVFPRAKAAAAKALDIDDSLAEAHGSLGMVNLFFDWNWPAAEVEFRRTLELNANYPTGHHWRENSLSAMGATREAVAEEGAPEAGPLSLIINAWVGRQLYFSRRYDEAITECRKALELDSNFVPAHWQLGSAYVQKAQYPEAVADLAAVRLTDGSRDTWLDSAMSSR